MTTKVSVVIITRNRARDLVQCLSSLFSQTQKIDEIVVINNGSNDETDSILKNISALYKKNYSIFRFYLEKKIGYSHARNLGLKKATGDWLAFIDDDCVADIDWYKNIKAGIKKLKNDEVVVLGKNKTYYNDNLFSLTEYFLDEYWKSTGMTNNGKIISGEVLDTKNIVYKKTFLSENNLKFSDEYNFDKKVLKRGEDIDFGRKIFVKNGKGLFIKNVIVFHKDSINYSSYLKKICQSLSSELVNEDRKKDSLIYFFKKFVVTENMGKVKSIFSFFLVLISILLIKILEKRSCAK